MSTEKERYPDKFTGEVNKPMKASNWFMRLWNDPVGSKVFAGFIIFLISIIYGAIVSLLKGVSMLDVLQTY